MSCKPESDLEKYYRSQCEIGTMTVVLGPVLQMVCGGGGFVFRVECKSFDDLVQVKKQCYCLLMNNGVEVKVERSGVFEE